MTEFLKVNAKAIAALIVPLVIAWIGWFAENAGIEWVPDPSKVEAVVVAVITAVTVWLTRNTTTNPPEEG